mgnify:CR=1 FL=1
MSKIVKMKFGPYEARLDETQAVFLITHEGGYYGWFVWLGGPPEPLFKEYIIKAERRFEKTVGKGTIPTKRVPIPMPPSYATGLVIPGVSITTKEVFDCELETVTEGGQP